MAPERAETPPADADSTCPRCGAPRSPRQEYCLECGLRLPPVRGVVPALGRAWRRRLPWYPGDWIWPALLGLVVAAAGATVAIATSDSAGGNASETIVATTAPPTTRVSTTATPPEPTTTVTATRRRPVAPPPARPTTSERPSTTTPRRQALVTWPAGRSGYTVVLASLPTSAGGAAARAKAREALAAGLADVGVLESGRFSSLHPGYFVVFSGIHRTFEEAQRAANAAARRYRAAYARQITP